MVQKVNEYSQGLSFSFLNTTGETGAGRVVHPRPKLENVGRKEREYLAHRREILRAAEKVFAAKGFFHTTMSKVAEAAEFGTGTLYKYFKSKEDLYFTLIEVKGEEINRLVTEELARIAPAKERIGNVVRIQFEFIERNRDFFRIF